MEQQPKVALRGDAVVYAIRGVAQTESVMCGASRWYAERAHCEHVLIDAFESGDRAWCVELIGRWARKWLRNGEIDRFLRWTSKLTRAEILSSEAIAISYIMHLILSRRFAEAAATLREAQRLIVANAATSSAGRARLATLQLMYRILSDTGSEDEVLKEPEGTESGSYLTATLMALQAYCLLRRNRFDAARRRAVRARDVFLGNADHYGASFAQVLLCVADRNQGDIDSAAAVCECMAELLQNRKRSPAWVNVATALAHMRYEQNRIGESEALYTEALPILSLAATPESFATAYLTLARIRTIQGRFDEAFELLDYLHGVLESARQRWLLALVCVEKVRLSLQLQMRSRAAAHASEFKLEELARRGEWKAPRSYDAAWERLGMARALMLLESGRYADCRRLLNILLASAQGAHYIYRVMPLEALLAVCEWQAGDQAGAYTVLNSALSRKPGQGLTRGVFDEAPRLREILLAAIQQGRLQHPLPHRYMEKFADVLGRGQSTPSPSGAIGRAMAEPLTDRERAILQLLAEGLSNRQISSRSKIAPSTVKWHLSNVFAKLEVSSRTGALARARELQLIETPLASLGRGLERAPTA